MAEAENFRNSRAGQGAGGQLAQARTAAGLTLADISARTRIAERHLLSLEESRYGDLASRTYAIGFARAYARVLDLDEQKIAAEVRTELAAFEGEERPRPMAFEPGDPARVPGPRVAWFAALGGLLVLVAVYFVWRSLIAPGGVLPDLTSESTPAPILATRTATVVKAPGPTAAGPVVFTAIEPSIWVKFYDGAGKQLMQKQMAQGESYTVPADAQRPQLWTGRPDALRITIGGQQVPPIATHQGIVRDVAVSAAALLARERPAEAAPAGAPPAPANTGSALVPNPRAGNGGAQPPR